MANTKLYTLLYTFNQDELIRLRQYVNSPFHNQHAGVAQLYDILVPSSTNHFSDKTLPKRQDLYKVLFPGSSYSDLKLRHLFSYLLKVIEGFLIQQELNMHYGQREAFLMKAYNRRKLPKFFNGALRQANRKADRATVHNAEFHLLKFQIHREEMLASLANSQNPYEPLEKLSQELDAYYLSLKLQTACSSLNHEQIFKVKYEMDFLPEILSYLEKHPSENQPAIHIYHCTYRMLSDEHPLPWFHELKNLLTKDGPTLSWEELRSHLLLAINFCIRQINTGNATFIQELFSLYKNALESRILFENDRLSPQAFKNIVNVGLKIRQYDWVESFIQAHAADLPPEVADSYRAFNLARLHFERSNYTETLKILSQTYHNDLFTNLDAKVLQVKAWYELGNYQQVGYVLENLKNLVRRKGKLAYHRKSYLNFIKFVKKVMNLGVLDVEGRGRLKSSIDEAGGVLEIAWLRVKVSS